MSLKINKGKGELSALQVIIMHLISTWARKNRTPIPHKLIIEELAHQEKPVCPITAKIAVGDLIRKGFIRKAIDFSHRNHYVQLRTIN